MEQVKNEKTFFEVFPTLRADGELKMLFQDTAEETISEEGDLDGCNSCGCIGGSTSGAQHRFLSLFFPAFTGE